MNSDMKKIKTRRKGRKRRVKTSKKVLFFLLSLGIAGVCIGVILAGLAFIQGKSQLLVMGLGYIAVFTAVLFTRSAIIQYDIVRKRRYAARR
jgi:polyferredoxin